MSEAKKGKKLSAETRAKISKVHKGRKCSKESRARMSEAQKGRKLSADTKEKIALGVSNAWKNKKGTKKIKKIFRKVCMEYSE